MTLSQNFFLTASKPSRRLITAAKRKEKECEKERGKNSKLEKPKDLGHLLLLLLQYLSTFAVSFYSEQISYGVCLEMKFAVTLDEDSFLPYISIFIP